MISFYFSVTNSMFKEQGMPELNVLNNWVLKHDTFHGFILAKTAGEVLNSIGKIEEPIAICKAIMNEADSINGLRCALVGDVIHHLPITIIEIMWINPFNK